MFNILMKTKAPLISLFIFMLGNGLFNTLIPIRMYLEGYNSLVIGFMGASFYLGLVMAAFNIERTIIRIGHIRAFAACASIMTVLTLLQAVIVHPGFWLVCRFFIGYATAGLFVVIESWLLSLGTIKTRGQVLSLYMIALYAAQGLGQFLIRVGDPQDLFLFMLVAMLTALSITPLSISQAVMPKFDEPSSLSYKKLYHKSASGIVGCVLSGLLLGAIYSLLPLYVQITTGDKALVANYMAAVIFGGMMLQYPVGHLSDFIERRTVLLSIILITIILSVISAMSFKSYYLSLCTMFLLGGMTFTIYPVSISHACDNLDHADIVSGTQALLLAYSLGATLGPILAPLPMKVLGPNGLFAYFAFVCMLAFVIIFWRRLRKSPSEQEESFRPIPSTTAVSAALDPRGESS